MRHSVNFFFATRHTVAKRACPKKAPFPFLPGNTWTTKNIDKMPYGDNTGRGDKDRSGGGKKKMKKVAREQ
jgi:hypothetical protein